MPNHKSAWKRMRQNEQRRLRNRAHRSSLRSTIKAFKAISEPEAAREQLPVLMSAIDKASKRGILHDRTAARMKSRLSKRLAGS
jgi:small subunit ribosomal protein S20